jgi:transposase
MNTKTKQSDERIFSKVECYGKLPDNPFERDVKFFFDGLDFFLLLPHTRQRNERKSNPDADMLCAIDPGVRKFDTTYSPQGVSEIIGTNTKKVTAKLERRIQRQKHRLKDFDATLDDFKYEFGWSRKVRRIWRLRRSRRHRTYLRAESKAKNVIKDVHYKISHYLCERYKSIFMPWTNSSQLMQGTLHKSTKRALSHLRWGQFRSRLSETASLYAGVNVFTGSEAYTSKQCGMCGEINDALGSSEVFTCAAKCSTFKADRDIHAARNICIRYLQ